MPPPSMQPHHDTATLMDLFVLLITTYMTCVRFPSHWKQILLGFYAFGFSFWAYGELQGIIKANAGLRLRATNAILCFLNLVLDAHAVRFNLRRE